MTLDDLRRAAELLPDGASLTLPRSALLEALRLPALAGGPDTAQGGGTWRERLWTCPPDTRLTVPDVAEAFGRPDSWVYRKVAKSQGAHRMPAAKLSGELVFTAGDLRAWTERETEAVG